VTDGGETAWSTTPVRAVLFDLDRTLVDIETGIKAGIEGHLTALGLPAGPDAYERWKAYEVEFVGRFVAGELGLQEQRRARARAMAGQPDLPDEAADVWFAGFHTRMSAAQCLFQDTVPALDALAAVPGLALGIVTNMDTPHQLEKLAGVGLGAERFACILGKDLLPGPKPHPGAFLAGCAALGVEPAETLFVGDEPLIDAVGARDAGLRAVWLDRTGRAAAIDPEPMAGIPVVASLGEVAALITERAANQVG
jgi:putative hydrolase of the HAD superfamily